MPAGPEVESAGQLLEWLGPSCVPLPLSGTPDRHAGKAAGSEGEPVRALGAHSPAAAGQDAQHLLGIHDGGTCALRGGCGLTVQVSPLHAAIRMLCRRFLPRALGTRGGPFLGSTAGRCGLLCRRGGTSPERWERRRHRRAAKMRFRGFHGGRQWLRSQRPRSAVACGGDRQALCLRARCEVWLVAFPRLLLTHCDNYEAVSLAAQV
mmetsp:Transcript_26432/g.66519  ORF Transcript_26432/g.66519 Transcript_26432/m.66519 type:complete len:207 (+) Transcript_26432:1745-2365(+)